MLAGMKLPDVIRLKYDGRLISRIEFTRHDDLIELIPEATEPPAQILVCCNVRFWPIADMKVCVAKSVDFRC